MVAAAIPGSHTDALCMNVIKSSDEYELLSPITFLQSFSDFAWVSRQVKVSVIGL